jgi:glycosyltransferase involved in cell wall biosynthesis
MITNLFDPYVIGGAERYVEYISKKLNKMGHEVIIITTKPFSNFSANIRVGHKDGIKIYRFYPMNIYWMYNYWRKNLIQKLFFHLVDFWNYHSFLEIRMILKKEKPDIVHTHNLAGISNSAILAVKSLNLPLVHTLHDFNLLTPNTFLISGVKQNFLYKFYSFLNKIITNNIDIVLGFSNFVLNVHKKSGFFSRTKTMKILPLVNTINKKWDGKIIDDVFDFLFVGHVSRYKGIMMLVKTFKSMNHKNIKLHIVGRGPELNKVKNIAKDDERIKFYGFLDWKELQKIYSRCDFLILPTLVNETFSLVILESFKLGLPVIGSDVGAVQELIKDGYNGFLFEPNNANELKSVMERIINLNKKELTKIRYNAINSAKKYDNKTPISYLIKIYSEAIIKNKKGLMHE